MTRPIKFRAWDKEKKEMDYMPSTSVYEAGTVWLNGFFADNSYFDLMQFTGLHDKNGKKIYEGDNVKWSDGWNVYIGKVYFSNGAFNEDAFKKPLFDICHQWDNGKWIECEVIGNIYENPELLKVETTHQN